MATAAPVITVEEYLSEVYEPDCDFVDGHLEERNLGEWDHSWLQAALIVYLYGRRKEWNIIVLPEQRVQVKKTRYRVPDVCVFARAEANGANSHEAPIHLHRNSVAGRSYEPYGDSYCGLS